VHVSVSAEGPKFQQISNRIRASKRKDWKLRHFVVSIMKSSGECPEFKLKKQCEFAMVVGNRCQACILRPNKLAENFVLLPLKPLLHPSPSQCPGVLSRPRAPEVGWRRCGLLHGENGGLFAERDGAR
jgi:hypothetical protein